MGVRVVSGKIRKNHIAKSCVVYIHRPQVEGEKKKSLFYDLYRIFNDIITCVCVHMIWT